MFKKIFIFLFFFLNVVEAWSWTDAISTNTVIRAIHINEIRNVINLKRTCYGLPGSTWTDDPIIGGSTKIKAVHVQELRNSIKDLYNNCIAGNCSGGTGNWSAANANWTDANLLGLYMKAAHINELRTTLDAITCNPYTYSWLVGSFSSCVGGTGTWSYSAWSPCYGGSAYYTYTPQTGCSKSCGGGVQTMQTNCYYYANSGSSSRSGTCNYTTNSGQQTRTVQCQRSDSVIVADSYCKTAKPSGTQACTPNNPAVCGTAALYQACTPGGGSCGAWTWTQGCNYQYCCNGMTETVYQNFSASCDPCTPINFNEPYTCYYPGVNDYGATSTATCYPGLVFFCSASGGSPTNINCPTQPTAINRTKTCQPNGALQ